MRTSSIASRLNSSGYGGLVRGTSHLLTLVFRPKPSGVLETGGTPAFQRSTRASSPTARGRALSDSVAPHGQATVAVETAGRLLRLDRQHGLQNRGTRPQ